MATIKISDLHPTGAELFSDSESYMGELSEHELSVYGGGTPLALIAASSAGCKVAAVGAAAFAVGYVKARWF